jgi:hypothetical protein
MLIIMKKPSSTTEPAVAPPQPQSQNPANHQNQTIGHNLQPPSTAGAGPQQPPGWLAPQMQATTYVTPGPPTYPPVASALPSSAYVPQPPANYAYPGGGYALPGNAVVHPVTLQPQLSNQLTAQERSQQEAFNRDMQTFNQVNILLLIITT